MAGLALLLVTLIMVIVLVRRRRRAAASSSSVSSSRRPVPPKGFDSPIYSVSSDVKTKLPAYSDLPFNPPAYSSFRSTKGENYVPAPPPSYTNPGYETLPEERKEMVVDTDGMKTEKQ